MTTMPPVTSGFAASGSNWGIDVSKGWLDVAQWPDQRAWRVTNDAHGWEQLIAQATETAPARIVLEATGGYETDLVVALDAAGLTPVVLNPMTARRFAQSHRYLAKTDRIDAIMLARFGAERCPTPRPIPSETMRNLVALLALRTDLVDIRVATKNRLHQARAVVRPHLERQLTTLTEEIASVEADLARLLTTDVAITTMVTRLMSVKGIGHLLATTLTVGLPELGTVTAKELAALVGVAPFANDSGGRNGARSIRGGRTRMRRALYQAVMTMLQWDPGMAAFYQRLKVRGKPTKVAMVACMNRLLRLLSVMVRTGCQWEELDVNQPVQAVDAP